jgi:hypothetical protein
MLALINPVGLRALRIAGMIFLIINLLGGAYIFRNRRRFFDKDPENVPLARASHLYSSLSLVPNSYLL